MLYAVFKLNKENNRTTLHPVDSSYKWNYNNKLQLNDKRSYANMTTLQIANRCVRKAQKTNQYNTAKNQQYFTK